MNIFTRKKKLLAEIANLNEQIRIQSREMDKLRSANTGLNDLWQDTKKKARQFGEEREAIKEELRAKGMEYAAAIGEKNQTIESLLAAIAEKDHTIAELQDTTSGLASSVSELKSQLHNAKARNNELKATIAALRQKQNYKARPKGPSPYIKPATNDPSNPLDL